MLYSDKYNYNPAKLILDSIFGFFTLQKNGRIISEGIKCPIHWFASKYWDNTYMGVGTPSPMGDGGGAQTLEIHILGIVQMGFTSTHFPHKFLREKKI